MHEGSKGFSLTEILIVVAITLIVAAIAIPNFLRSRATAGQASAVDSLQALNTAEAAYSATFGGGFSPDMSSLGPPPRLTNATSTAANLIDGALAQGTKGGYRFSYLPGAVDSSGRISSYAIIAGPEGGSAGSAIYATDQSGVVRYVGNGSGSTISPYTSATNTPTACAESGNLVTVSSTLNPPVGGVVYWSGAAPAGYNSGMGGWVVTDATPGNFSFHNTNGGLADCTVMGTLILP